MTRLTKSGNDAEVTHHTNLRIYKSQIPFESDTYIGNNVSLDIAKYYFTIPFFPLPHSVYGGVLEYKQVCCGMFTYLHKHASH